MAKKVKAKPRGKKNLKKSERQIRKEEMQMILHELQKAADLAKNERNSSDASSFRRSVTYSTPRTRNETQAFLSSQENFALDQSVANNYDKDTISADKCVRCKHFLEIPQNFSSQPFDKKISGVMGQCKAELNFVQAMVWLKSATACVSQLSVEQLQRIFNKQWNKDDSRNQCENKYTNDKPAEQCSVNNNLSLGKSCSEINMQNICATSTPQDISNPLCSLASQKLINRSHSTPGNTRSDAWKIFSATDINKLKETANDSWVEEKVPSFITQNKKQPESLSVPDTISEMNVKLLSNASTSTFRSSETFDSSIESQNKRLKSMKATKRLKQIAESYTQQENEQIMRDTVVTRNESSTSQSLFNNNFKNTFFYKKIREVVPSEQHKSVSPTINESISEKNLQLDSNFDIFTPMTNPPLESYNVFSSDYSPNCFATTQPNSFGINDDIELWGQSSSRNYHINYQTPPDVSHDDGIKFEMQIDDTEKSEMRMNIPEQQYDSAYSTLGNVYQINKHISDSSNTRRHYELRSCKKKTISPKKKSTVTSIHKEQQSMIEKRKSKGAKNSSEGKEKCKKGTISAKWLNFTLQSLNVEHVILQSVKVILSSLSNNGITKEYAVCKRWQGTLEQEAVRAVLDVSDILRIERKPDICRKEVVKTIIKTLKRITTCALLNKTSGWIYHIQIILELCNSLSISIAIIDHLIEMLKSFQISLSHDVTEIQLNMHVTIGRLHLVFYALNNVLRKYRTIIPSNRKSDFTDVTIPHVTECWKTRYIDQELEDGGLNLDASEEKWCNALKNFAVAFTDCNYVQFAEKSLSLIQVLIE